MRRILRCFAAVLPLLLACGGDTLNGIQNKPPVAHAGNDLQSKVGEEIRFDGSASTDPDGEIASFSWDFGDGTKGTGKVTTHAFQTAGTFTVTLTVTDDAGASASDTLLATIAVANEAPHAIIVVSANAVQAGTNVNFDASQSTDDGHIVGWAWDFGDGATATTETATHSYAQAGSYTVHLTVTDDGGLTGTDDGSTKIRVQAPPPPPANFPAVYSYGPVNPSDTSRCYGFQAEPLHFTVPNPTAPTSSLTVVEGSGLVSVTYSGTFTSASRQFTATNNGLGSSQTLAGTFSADFKSFDGTYSGGSCSSPLDIHGTRTSPP